MKINLGNVPQCCEKDEFLKQSFEESNGKSKLVKDVHGMS